MDLNELRNAIMAAGWSASTLELAEKTGFRCEYCGKDFFGGLDDYYSFEVEHIIPRGKGEDKAENLTVACSTCNFLKRRWDPRSTVGDDATRDQLISSARQYVLERRKVKEDKVEKERNLARQIIATRGG